MLTGYEDRFVAQPRARLAQRARFSVAFSAAGWGVFRHTR